MITIGEFIRTTREEKNISQAHLCRGFCSTSTLSRIENGHQIPYKATYEALLERLGVTPEMFPSFDNVADVVAYRLKHQISQTLDAGKYEEVEALLEQLEANMKLEEVYKNYVLYVRAVLAIEKGQPPDEALPVLEKIAKKFVMDISPDSILSQVLAQDNLIVLNRLAICYYHADKKEDAIALLYALKEYIEQKMVDDKEISTMYTELVYNLSKFVGSLGQHNEVIRLCDIGIQRCIEYQAYRTFGDLLYNKGYALVMLGRNDEARKYIQEAYYLDRATGALHRCEIIKQFADKQGIEL